MTWRDAKDLRDDVSPPRRDLLGRFRRMVIKLTSRSGAASAIWQMLGHRDELGRAETVDVEVFPGVGIYARPKAGGKAEAVIVHVGGPDQPIAVATRNEDIRRQVLADVKEDETAIYTSTAVVLINADGTIEIRSAGGLAVPLATLADVQAIQAALDLHTHAHGDPTVGTGPAVPAPTGTTKLRGE